MAAHNMRASKSHVRASPYLFVVSIIFVKSQINLKRAYKYFVVSSKGQSVPEWTEQVGLLPIEHYSRCLLAMAGKLLKFMASRSWSTIWESPPKWCVITGIARRRRRRLLTISIVGDRYYRPVVRDQTRGWGFGQDADRGVNSLCLSRKDFRAILSG